MNQAADHVRATKEQSAVREFVADHGRPIDRNDIEHVTIAGRSIAVAEDLTEAERELVADAIRATEPAIKACFANSLELWEYDERFKYTEGYAALSEFDVGGFGHTWCMLDSEKLVDVTTTFDHYFGAVITDEATLQQQPRDRRKARHLRRRRQPPQPIRIPQGTWLRRRVVDACGLAPLD